MNNKGIMFTLTAILLSIMFILLFSIGQKNKLNNNIDLEKSKADTIKYQYDAIKEYSKYALAISGKACIKDFAKAMISEGYFFKDKKAFESNLSTCILNGTINLFSEYKTQTNLSFNKLLEQFINLTYKEYKINMSIEITNISTNIGEINRIDLSSNISIHIFNSEFEIKSNKISLQTSINFNNIPDPYYSINIGEFKIFDNIALIGVNDDRFKNIGFDEFLNNVSYIQYYKGNDIISKFINKSESSDYGLISFVNISSNSKNLSYVDIYFIKNQSFDCSKLYCRIGSCGDTDFAIDEETFLIMKSRYNLSSEGWTKKC